VFASGLFVEFCEMLGTITACLLLPDVVLHPHGVPLPSICATEHRASRLGILLRNCNFLARPANKIKVLSRR
jgi:hypothetical protein